MKTGVLLVPVCVLLVGCKDDCTPTTSRGECNIVEQCGCPEDHWCTWTWDFDLCDFWETCMGMDVIEPGALEVGEVCVFPGPYTVDECKPGSICMGTVSIPDPLCSELCTSDSDCSLPGSACIHPLVFSLPDPCDGEWEAPMKYCSM
jgi:hypothetical protein